MNVTQEKLAHDLIVREGMGADAAWETARILLDTTEEVPDGTTAA